MKFKKNRVVVFIAFLFITSLSNLTKAALLIKSEKSSEKFEDVELLSSATLGVDKVSTILVPVSHGLRKKAVFGLVPVRVYVMQLLSAKPDQLVKSDEGFLKSLKLASPILMQITFLRDLPGSRISEAFKEGLESNKINSQNRTEALDQVLSEISNIKEFKKSETFSIAITWKQDQARIDLEQPGSEVKTISGSNEFAEQFLSIWFGKPSDGKLGELKKSLIK